MPKENNTEKDPMVEFVVEQFKLYESFHSSRMDDMKEIYSQWNNEQLPKGLDWMNAVPVPLMIEAEQTISPRLFAALFPTDTPVDLRVEGDDPDYRKANKIKSLLKKHFKLAEVQKESVPMLGQSTLFGTGYCEAGTWIVKRKWLDIENEGRQERVVESRPDCKWVNFFEMYPHPAKMEIGDGLPLIRRRFVDGEYLKSLSDGRYELDNLKKALESESPIETNSTFIKPSGDDNYKLSKKNEYEILEYWGYYDEKFKVGTETRVRRAVPYWIIIINRAVKVRGISNPYNHQIEPYCKIKLYTDLKPSWFGVGIGKVGKPSQDRANKIVNQRLNNVDLVLNKQGFYNANDPSINLSKLKTSSPGQWHGVSDVHNSIKWMDIPDVTASSYEEEKLAKQDFREATGATSHLLPTSEGEKAHRTAMGIQLLQGAAGMRFRPVLKLIEIDFIARVAFFFFSNLQQFMATPTSIFDEETKETMNIDPQELQAKIDFIPTGIAETLNKEVQIGQLLRFKEVTANDPTVNRREINRRIGELFGFRDLDKLSVQEAVSREPGGLDKLTQQLIQQRVQEGATSEEIKQEFLGQPPVQEPEEGEMPQ